MAKGSTTPLPDSPIFLHEQLKLARAARGLPETTVLLKDHSLPSGTICLLKVRLVVTNPAVRRGTIHISILDPKQPVIVDFKLFYSSDKIFVVILNCFFNALDGWVQPCPLHPLRRRRCKFAAFPKRTIFLYFFLRTSFRPEIEVINHFWVRCCGRLAQSGLHSASEKTIPCLSCPYSPDISHIFPCLRRQGRARSSSPRSTRRANSDFGLSCQRSSSHPALNVGFPHEKSEHLSDFRRI